MGTAAQISDETDSIGLISAKRQRASDNCRSRKTVCYITVGLVSYGHAFFNGMVVASISKGAGR